jgi:hypothetical protein
MKQILSAILGLMMFTCVSAQVDQNDITMVSYDHSCMEGMRMEVEHNA